MSTVIYQTGGATATFLIGDGPLNSDEPCSAILLFTAYDDGTWEGDISLSWTDGQGNNWGFDWDVEGPSSNTPVYQVDFIEAGPGGGYINYWGQDQWGQNPPTIDASVDWVTVPSGWVGTWMLTLNAANIPSSMNPNSPDLTVKFVSVTIDVLAGSIQTVGPGGTAEATKRRKRRPRQTPER